MVSLVCDHIICSQCADTLKSVEGHRYHSPHAATSRTSID